MYLQGAKPASHNEEESRDKGKSRSKRLAKQARKLRGIFKKQGTEGQLSRLGHFHENPSHETQHKENIPEWGGSSKEGLPTKFDNELHILDSSLPQVPDGVDPEDRFALLRARRHELTLAREREVAICECIPECPCTCGSRVVQVDRAETPESILSSQQSHSGSGTKEQNLESVQTYTSQESKRHRRRESHNLVERRRRDKINELIQQLSHLVPLHRFEDYNAKLARAGRTGESLDNGPNKGDVLHETVSWTVDLMRALYGKIQQQSKAREYIHSLGGIWPFESNEVERRLQNEVIEAFDANGQISFSRPWDRDVNRKRPESWEPKISAKGANHSEPALRTKASHGSLISFSGSVHSLTSLTYRSASGEIKTEHAENVSNFEFKRETIDRVPGDKLKIEAWEAGTPRRHSKLPFVPKTDNDLSHRPSLDQGIVPNTQTFATFPTSEELDEAPIPGLDIPGLNEHDVQKPGKQSSKLTPESHTSLDSLDVSRRDDVVPGTAQRLDEAHSSAINDLADVNDLSVQNQTQPSIATKMHRQAGLRPFRLHEDPLLETLSSIASSGPCPNLADSDPRVTYLENKLVRLRWKCNCNHPFQVDVFEHEEGAALAAIQELDQSNRARDESFGPLHCLFVFLARIGFLLHIFRNEREIDETLPITNPLPTKADDIIKTRLNPADPDPERYVCVCFPGMTYKKYLHHIDVNKTIDDQHLFAAIQNKYYDWKPFWRRIFTLRTLARVEYFEFKIYYSNLVTIKDDWRDRFPQGHDPGEWSYNPTSRDMTPYLIDDVLTHYVHSPQCAKIGKYFWNRIPKKFFCRLECPNEEPFKIGWGLYFVEEFSQFYLMLILVPVLAAGIALAIWYCICFHKSFADGATVVSGFAAVVMYLFSVAQGWYKQKGAL